LKQERLKELFHATNISATMQDKVFIISIPPSCMDQLSKQELENTTKVDYGLGNILPIQDQDCYCSCCD
jgi:hypothetical protein